MTLPNFIGIGVQKGGTSWLHRQLLNHPQVFVPETRKEIHFFDWYFDRGVNWYQKWFPKDARDYKAIGEITPEYIYFNDVLPCMEKILPPDQKTKFIAILRHPVKRAYSHYQMIFQSGEGFNYKDFDDFMEKHPHGFKRGLYASQLKRWFDVYEPKQFLILTSEEMSSNTDETRETFNLLGNFLNIDPALFSPALAQQRIGKARSMPRFPRIMKFAQTIRQKLRDWDMDFIAIALKKIGITRQLFSSTKPIPPLTEEQKMRWIKAYEDDIKELEKLLNRSFSNWA